MSALGLTPSYLSLVNALHREGSMSTYVHIRVGRRSKDTVPYLGQKMTTGLGNQENLEDEMNIAIPSYNNPKNKLGKLFKFPEEVYKVGG